MAHGRPAADVAEHGTPMLLAFPNAIEHGICSLVVQMLGIASMNACMHVGLECTMKVLILPTIAMPSMPFACIHRSLLPPSLILWLAL